MFINISSTHVCSVLDNAEPKIVIVTLEAQEIKKKTLWKCHRSNDILFSID